MRTLILPYWISLTLLLGAIPALRSQPFMLDRIGRHALFEAYGHDFGDTIPRYTWTGWREEPRPFLAAEMRAGYAEGARATDGRLRDAMAFLGEKGLLDDALLVVTSDHGEAFGEHGKSQHDDVLFQEGAHVPLLVLGPAELIGPPRRVGGLRQVTDVAATVAQLVGVPGADTARAPAQGISLLAEPVPDRVVFLVAHMHSGGMGMLRATPGGLVKTLYEPRLGSVQRFVVR